MSAGTRWNGVAGRSYVLLIFAPVRAAIDSRHSDHAPFAELLVGEYLREGISRRAVTTAERPRSRASSCWTIEMDQ